MGYSRPGSHSPRLRPRPARLPRQRQTRRRLLARLLRAVRSRFSRCFGHRESDVRGQLARRPHSPPPGALRAGSRNGPDPRRQRRPRVRGQSRVHLRQRSPPRRGGDALLEDPVRRLPEGVGADGVALHTSPRSVPREWLAEQCRLAQSPGYLEAHLSVLRAIVSPLGQREVLVDRLPSLKVPTLVVWGERDRVFPQSQAREAVTRLRDGSLSLIPNCGHMPHVECPDRFLGALDGFLLKRVLR